MKEKYFEVSYHPKEKEEYRYKIKVSRDNYNWYESKTLITWAKSLDFEIIIQRTIEIRKDFCAYLIWEVFLEKTDKQKTVIKWNALWNWLWYKNKEEWEKIIFSYKTFWQLKRDFLL